MYVSNVHKSIKKNFVTSQINGKKDTMIKIIETVLNSDFSIIH